MPLDFETPPSLTRLDGAESTAVGRGLVILGLYGLGFGQALLAMLGANPELFVFHGVSGAQAAIFAFVAVFAVPAALWGIGELARRLSRRAGQVVHLLTVAALGAGIALAFAGVVISGPVLALLAAVAGAGMAASHVRWEAARIWSRFLVIVPIAAFALFWFGSPAGGLLRSSDTMSVAEPAQDMPSVVVLLLDELPTKSLLDESGAISATRFPNLAALAEEADWYPEFTASAPLTKVAVPSILTSRAEIDEPELHTNYPDNLFSMLEDTHEQRVFESFTKLCAGSTCEGEAQDADLRAFVQDTGRLFRTRLTSGGGEVSDLGDFEEVVEERPSDPVPPALAGGTGGFEAMRGVDATRNQPVRFSEFVDSIEEGELATLHFLHLLLPHQPWRYLPDGTRYETPLLPQATYPFSRDNSGDEWLSVLTEYRHLLQAQYADALVGDLVSHLKVTGTWDSSLVVVLADHGISFERDTPIRTLTDESLDSIAYAPLFVKRPGQESGTAIDANVLAVDVLPTIADILGVEPDFAMDGLPIDSDGVAARGDAKSIVDLEDVPGAPQRGVIEFSTADTRPRAADRWIGDLEPGAPPIDALNRYLGIIDVVGTTLDTGDERAGSGEAVVERLARLERPPDHQPEGLVLGEVTGVGDLRPDDLALLVIDGEVATGSPLFEIGGSTSAFAMMLPEDDVTTDKSIDIAILHVDGTWTSLTTSD